MLESTKMLPFKIAAFIFLITFFTSDSTDTKQRHFNKQGDELDHASNNEIAFKMGVGDGLTIEFYRIDNKVNLYLETPTGKIENLGSTRFYHDNPALTPSQNSIEIINCCTGKKMLAQYYTLIIELENEANSNNYNPYQAVGRIIGTKYVDPQYPSNGTPVYYVFDYNSGGKGTGLSGVKIRHKVKFQAF